MQTMGMKLGRPSRAIPQAGNQPLSPLLSSWSSVHAVAAIPNPTYDRHRLRKIHCQLEWIPRSFVIIHVTYRCPSGLPVQVATVREAKAMIYYRRCAAGLRGYLSFSIEVGGVKLSSEGPSTQATSIGTAAIGSTLAHFVQ